MVKLAIQEDHKCDACGKESTELLVVTDPGIFIDSHFYICQSCVSKWFKSFNKDK